MNKRPLNKRDEVMLRLLKMPPKPHAQNKPKRAVKAESSPAKSKKAPAA